MTRSTPAGSCCLTSPGLLTGPPSGPGPGSGASRPVSCGTPSSGSRWRSTALSSSANITGDPRRGAGTPRRKRPNCSGPLDTAASGCSAASPTSRPASRTGSTACWASGQHHHDGRTAHPRCRGRLRAAGSRDCIGDRWYVPPGSRGWHGRHTPRRPSALSTPASPADSRTCMQDQMRASRQRHVRAFSPPSCRMVLQPDHLLAAAVRSAGIGRC